MTLMSKTVLALAGAVLLANSVAAFTPWGPLESWQTSDLDYGARPIQGGAELGGPKNLGEEWRINTPIITYGFDFSFLDYFGTNGVKAIDDAMGILNRLPAVSRTRPDLSEYLQDGNQRIKQSAQALNLFDLKSESLHILVEHMGLFSADTHVFDLRARLTIPNSPPCFFNYYVIGRNFDPITWEPSHYVNGVLYTYTIQDECPVRQVGDAVEVPVDPTAITPTAVSALTGLQVGGFYLGLTRDDVGGLRYLYRHDNYNNEILPADATMVQIQSPFTPVNIFATNTTATNTLALRGGVEHIKFIKTRFGSDLGTTFQPMLFTYNQLIVTNFHLVNQTVRRRITRPDIIFAAADITAPPAVPSLDRSVNFSTNGNVSVVNIAGPGNIAPQMLVTFNKVGPMLFNANPVFLDEQSATSGFVWGSFDGTTNDPVVYPQGSSIRALEAQVLDPSLINTNFGGGFNPTF